MEKDHGELWRSIGRSCCVADVMRLRLVGWSQAKDDRQASRKGGEGDVEELDQVTAQQAAARRCNGRSRSS